MINWIDVRQCLPQPFFPVLISTTYYCDKEEECVHQNFMYVGFISADEKWNVGCVGCESSIDIVGVTHWTLLPPDPALEPNFKPPNLTTLA